MAKELVKVDPVTGFESKGPLKVEEIAAEIRPFAHTINVAWDGETVILLPAGVSDLLKTTGAKNSTQLEILASNELTQMVFRPGAAYEFVESSGDMYFKWNLTAAPLKASDQVVLRRGK